MKLYLVGFMGVGKTTVGRLLAERLRIPFCDLDHVIEQQENRSIATIFAAEGEAYFRAREREVLRTTRSAAALIVATGGGTFTVEENIQFIKGQGLSIHLAATFDVVKSRMIAKANDRPLFRDERAAYDLYQYRWKYYKMADMSFEVRASETPSELVERLLISLPREFHESLRRSGGNG